MRTKNFSLLTLVLPAFLSGQTRLVQAAMVNLQAVADTTLFQNSPDNNLGGSTNFITGTLASGFNNRALIEFSPSVSIPANAVITSVTLTLNVTAANGPNSTFDLHPMLVSWGEGNKTGPTGAPASAGEATWNARFNSSTLWSTPGGAAGADYSATSSDSAFISGLGSYTFGSTPGLVEDVQNWLDHPSGDFGWMLLSQSEGTMSTARRFASREDTLGRGPLLSIDYSVVPEPSTLALFGLGIGAFAWAHRRRRISNQPESSRTSSQSTLPQ